MSHLYATARESHTFLQWDPSSRFPQPDPGSAPDNCGPTSVTNVAGFYRDDDDLSIYNTRLLGAPAFGPTNITQQKEMLIKRGVNCFFSQFAEVSRIHDLIEGGQRPTILGLNMSLVPLEVAGHPFRGFHAVVALENERRDGVGGMLIRDPNFNRTFRQDPTGGARFYPDWVIQQAFCNARMWALVPVAPKKIPQLPDTAVEFPTVDGDPMPGPFRGEIDEHGQCIRRVVEANKPIRKGYTVASGLLFRTGDRREFNIVGRIPKEDDRIPKAEKDLGDALITVVYDDDQHGSVFGYIKQVDVAGN